MRTLLHFLRWKLGLAEAETQTTAAERECLARHAAGRKRVVEIGVWYGVTTARLLGAIPDDAVLYAVDPYTPGRLGVNLQEWIAHGTVRRLSRGRVRWIRDTGASAGER